MGCVRKGSEPAPFTNSFVIFSKTCPSLGTQVGWAGQLERSLVPPGSPVSVIILVMWNSKAGCVTCLPVG